MVVNYFVIPAITYPSHKPHRVVDAERIVRIVCAYFKISGDEIRKKSRKRVYVEPRQIAMYLLTRHSILSLKEIATLLGAKDHTNVINNRDTIAGRVKFEPAFANVVNEVESLI
jgi:chromosomal replication initiator protein